MKDIAEYVPIGYKNAISRTQLAIRSGLSDRQLRKAIKDSNSLICNLSDGEGYFIPGDGEERFVRAFRTQESRRSLTTTQTVKKCDAWIREHRRKKSILETGQMDIFDFLQKEPAHE